MMRRGLTEEEINKMPVTQYWELYIFDSFLEPQGPAVQDLHQAQIAHSLYMTAPGMTKAHADKIKLSDFMFQKDTVFPSEEQKAEQQTKKNAIKSQNVQSQFSPELIAKAKKMAQRKKNG
ncbi:DUF4035 domain-containing protein [Pantoea sp. MBLJ3]|uniref:phage tail assembly protein T n=1 Tax=Pantoea sp. MBLJ3 TaxID=1562889 RepID=UPI0012E01D66|nr:DUF4035 domain-containing protein [Pantoea sp. MBLJ3]